MEVCLAELSKCFDSLFEDTAQRKKDWTVSYSSLYIKQAGYRAELTTIEVGFRGLPNIAGFLKLRSLTGPSKCSEESLMIHVGRQAILDTFRVWCEEQTLQALNSSIHVFLVIHMYTL